MRLTLTQPKTELNTVTGYIEGTDKLFLVHNNEVIKEITLSATLDSLFEIQFFCLVADNRLYISQTNIDLLVTVRAEKVTFAVE